MGDERDSALSFLFSKLRLSLGSGKRVWIKMRHHSHTPQVLPSSLYHPRPLPAPPDCGHRPAVGKGLETAARLRCRLQWNLNASEPATQKGGRCRAALPLAVGPRPRGEQRGSRANQRRDRGMAGAGANGRGAVAPGLSHGGSAAGRERLRESRWTVGSDRWARVAVAGLWSAPNCEWVSEWVRERSGAGLIVTGSFPVLWGFSPPVVGLWF